jgi:transcriptional regulator with XRE-family HTH domain
MPNAIKSPKARVLGGMLRDARERAEIGLRRFAISIGHDPSMLSRWETGERVPKLTDVAQILTKLDITGRRFEEILTFAEGAGEQRWLATGLPEQRQQLAALVEFERWASLIVTCSPLLIPGLLQADGYVRAIMSGGGLTQEQTDDRIAIRVMRRQPLLRANPVRLRSFIGESAIRQLIGNRQVMVEQLRHLLIMAELPNIELRVVPADVGWHPGLEGPFYLIESPEAGPVISLEARHSGLFLHEPGDVLDYRGAIDMIGRMALGEPESVLFIAAEADRMERTGDDVSEVAQGQSQPVNQRLCGNLPQPRPTQGQQERRPNPAR